MSDKRQKWKSQVVLFKDGIKYATKVTDTEISMISFGEMKLGGSGVYDGNTFTDEVQALDKESKMIMPEFLPQSLETCSIPALVYSDRTLDWLLVDIDKNRETVELHNAVTV